MRAISAPTPANSGVEPVDTPLGDESVKSMTSESSEMDDAFAAAQTGDLARITELFDAKAAGVDDVDDSGVGLLHWAAANSRVDICQYLLEHGAKLEAQGGPSKEAALLWGVRYGNLDVVMLLCESGANIHAKGGANLGLDALHIAIRRHHISMCVALF